MQGRILAASLSGIRGLRVPMQEGSGGGGTRGEGEGSPSFRSDWVHLGLFGGGLKSSPRQSTRGC